MELPTEFVTPQSLTQLAGMASAMLAVAVSLYLLGIDMDEIVIWVGMLSLVACLFVTVARGPDGGIDILVAAFNGVITGVTAMLAFYALRPALAKQRAKRLARKRQNGANAQEPKP